jgi:hypothetical protein
LRPRRGGGTLCGMARPAELRMTRAEVLHWAYGTTPASEPAGRERQPAFGLA